MNIHKIRGYHVWTYLIDLARDSFDLAIAQNKQLAQLLLHKWQLYPYSIFYRLILYAVTKHSALNEDIAIMLFEEKADQTLWSTSCQNEVLKYLQNRDHSKSAVNKLLSLIMKGPPRSLFKEDIEDKIFDEIKERSIYQRLNRLESLGIKFPENIERYYKKIASKYSFKPSVEKDDDQEDFPFFHEASFRRIGSENRYRNLTNEQIFEDIKHTKPNAFPTITDKRENFRSFIKDFTERAFKILLMFQDDDINSAPYWGDFISDTSMMTDIQQSNGWFLKSFEKIENYNDKFFIECLWSLVHGFNLKGSLIYYEDKEQFKKWWNRLWILSIQDTEHHNYSDISSGALNSHLGKLSQSIFYILWSKFPDKIPRDGKIPEDIKKYFQIIIQDGINKDFSALYHFGSYLWSLWFLDKEWTRTSIKPLMNWNQNEDVCKAFWAGYLHHPRWSVSFLSDFKSELFQLLLNREKFYGIEKENVHTTGYCENISDLFLITTGGREIENIFIEKETTELKKNMDVPILESFSRKIKSLLKDSGDKSANLWFYKVQPWVEEFWPPQKKVKTQKIAQNLSLATLHCGEKLSEAVELLKGNIKGIIKKNHGYIAHYIMRYHKKELTCVFDYPNELLSLLNWNFPEDEIPYYDGEKVKEILDELKSRNPTVEQNSKYIKLLEKLS